MIPAKLEELILNNQARFETRVFGLQQYSLLPCPDDCKIVIVGYDFQPANIVNDIEDSGVANSYQGLQRVSFFDGSRYDHFLHKMSGMSLYNSGSGTNRAQQGTRPFHKVDSLYMIYNRDIGVEVAIAPEMQVFPAGLNLALVSQLFPQNLSSGQDFNEYTDGANFGGSLNATPQYSQAYSAPVTPPDFVDFNFEDSVAAPHRYNTTGSNVYDKNEITNAWFLLVKYVVIFNRPESSR